jgi:hypothetical protein
MMSVTIILIHTFCGSGVILSATDEVAPGRELAKQAVKAKEVWITADHSKHQVLQQEFKSGPEVTKACLSCHSEAASQFHKTIHWTWLDPATTESKVLGKGGLSINNF